MMIKSTQCSITILLIQWHQDLKFYFMLFYHLNDLIDGFCLHMSTLMASEVQEVAQDLVLLVVETIQKLLYILRCLLSSQRLAVILHHGPNIVMSSCWYPCGVSHHTCVFFPVACI